MKADEEVKSTQKNRVGRPRAVAVDITAVKILAELEIVSKHYLDLQKKREELIVRAFDNKVSAREIAEATGITKFNAKYFQEQKRKGLIGGEIK